MDEMNPTRQHADLRPLVDHKKLSLNEWLKIVLTPEEDRVVRTQVCCFPTDQLLHEFLLNVDIISDVECRHLLRSLLVGAGTYGFDRHNFRSATNGNIESFSETEYFRRLITGQKAWEGIHWILDLLPSSPTKALDVIDTFLLCFCQHLSDGFLNGLSDAQAIVKAKYIKRDHQPSVLLDLTPREFEFLAFELFSAMGYEFSTLEALGMAVLMSEHPSTKLVSARRYSYSAS
jgi:restriction system protein